ncbi:MAG: ABC transporter permease subunit [Spirochaetia bacterium]
MFRLENLKRSAIISFWFVFLTFPITVLRVNTIEDTIRWRWYFIPFVAVIAFFMSLVWNYLLERQKIKTKKDSKVKQVYSDLKSKVTGLTHVKPVSIAAVVVLIVAFPFIASFYQTNIMLSALMYIMLALGLNIVVGIAGILHLGHAAFFAIGAYSYALLNYHFGLNFWFALPVGGFLGFSAGVLLSLPILRLRGDYLAIVTLAFGEIVRIVLENWNELSFGPSGIANIPRPAIPGLDLGIIDTTRLVYYLLVAFTALTIVITLRLKDSRIGRALIAMREDEIASQAMGINITKIKVLAFGLGSAIAGVAGVVFAARTTFINPTSFRVWESVIILCIVVLGGRGSIVGVTFAGFIIILLPEYLRAFSEYRMLMFGALLVIMMIFKPNGIIPAKRKHYKINRKEANGNENASEETV